MKRVFSISMFSVIFAIAIVSCKKDEKEVRVSDVTFDQTPPYSVDVGQKLIMTAKIVPANATDQNLTVTSDNTAVATVESKVQGSKVTVTVTGVSPGKANIKVSHAKYGTLAAVEVTVNGTAEPEKTLTKIEVTGTPEKTAYFIGETFDPAGLTVTATYSDGSTETVPLDSPDLVFEANFGAAGNDVTITVKFTYKGVEKTFELKGKGINVSEVALTKIEVTGTPEKTEYYVGEAFDPKGITVTATYSDGSTKVIPLAELEFDADFNTAGANKTVTVKFTYKGVTKTYDITGITVSEALPASIAVTTPPTQIIYGIGEPFNPEGMVVTATYATGDPKTIPNAELEFEYDFMTASAGTNTRDKTVNVKYKGQSATVTGNVTVRTLEWRIAAVLANGTATIYLYASEAISATITIPAGKEITLKGVNDKLKITRTASGFFTINGTLVFDEYVSIDNDGLAHTGELIYINTSGKLIMKDGSKLTGGNCTATGNRAFVYMSGGTFEMQGGTISDNNGVNLCVLSMGGGSFNMSDGVITGNKSTGTEGSILFVDMWYATFNMSGGEISGNEAARGGGVYVNYSSILNMSGGKIVNNTASICGDDVYINHQNGVDFGTFNLSGNAQIGNISLFSYTANRRAKFTLADNFTGSAGNIDLQGYVGTSNFNDLKSWWTGNPVITPVEGQTLTKAVLDKFTLRNFVDNDGTTKQAIAPGYHLYGTKDGENDTAKMGLLYADTP